MADRVVARRYAEAFVGALVKSGRLEAGLAELEAVARTYRQSKDLQRFLGSPEIDLAPKQALLEKLWSDASGKETIALLQLLLRWDRVDHLPETAEESRKAAEERQGILRGTVTTAHAISSAEAERLAEAVGRKMGKKVVLGRRVDASVLGGAQVAVGSTLLDGSVLNMLEQVREQLLAVKVNS
ncbi:MAG: ATP synthase F1 subunit delta [Candidatus Omnitrophica bacterium]|nr:ATP synthase F1 subunit delta [Candidatus Omnitrophota bacterium]